MASSKINIKNYNLLGVNFIQNFELFITHVYMSCTDSTIKYREKISNLNDVRPVWSLVPPLKFINENDSLLVSFI